MSDNDNTSHLPAAFVSRLEIQYGSRSSEILKALTEPPVISVRINPLKWNIYPQMGRIPWTRFGFYLKNRPSYTLDPWLHAGAYYVQEAGSMLLEQAFNAIPVLHPRIVLDLCGAPGGKSTHLLSLLSGDDVLVSNEVIRSRAVILQENLQKWGHDNVIVTNNDPRDFSACNVKFDVIVADVPCSGEGLFRKDPSSVGEWSTANTQLCASRQKRILADAWNVLKEGGYLIYSTCTFNPAENEENLYWLTEQFDAEPVSFPADPHWKLNRIGFKNIEGYQTLPGSAMAEGFFIGILRKKEKHEITSLSNTETGMNNLPHENYIRPSKNKATFTDTNLKKQKNELKNWIQASERELSVIKVWINDALASDFLIKGNIIHYVGSTVRTLLSGLSSHINILQAGLPVAEVKGRDYIPLHPLALSVRLNIQHFSMAELSLEDAVRYLRKDNLQAKLDGDGWFLAAYRGLPLGWIKNIGNRNNNYYPKEWRIRMDATGLSSPWHENNI